MSEKMSAPLVVAKKTKVPKMKITTAAISKPTYSAMVTKAIVELKEKKGSSRSSIMKYLIDNYKLDPATAQPLLNKTLAKLSTACKLVPGAVAGKTGAGCYKLSVEEKEAIKKVEKAALKKMAEAAKKSSDVPAKKAAGKKASVAKKVAVKKSSSVKKTATKAKVMKKVSKAAAGAKMKKGSAKPKKVAKKSKK